MQSIKAKGNFSVTQKIKVVINFFFFFFLQLPLDLSTLSAEEKKRILDMRKPKKKVVIEEEIKDKFDFKNYVKYVNKK